MKIFAGRNDEISFLGAMIRRLAEKIMHALPPLEEARAKHWWQFWRR